MASKQAILFVLAAIVVVALPAVAQAVEHVVGDDKGWTINFNYTAWAEGKKFQVGDTLVFKYPMGYHNVYKVSGPMFQGCNVPSMNEIRPLTSGNDVIALSTPGKKWYICGVGNGKHCMTGQRLVIDVMPAWEAKAPSPTAPAWEAKDPSPSAPAWWGPAAVPTSSPGHYWSKKGLFKY